MPLTRFLGGTAFGPDQIAVMVAAYEGAMGELNFSGPDPGAETLAKTIAALAKQGERNPLRLQQRAIDALSGTPPVAASV
jgi:hypothetical protein